MIRSTVFVLAILSFLAVSSVSVNQGSSDRLPTNYSLSQIDVDNSKNKQAEDLERKLEKAFKPLIQLKNSIVPHLPKKELNAAKRAAFRILLIAQRYLS